jgi:hypothetical protein
MSQADFYRFPPLKSALKGRRFGDASDIIKNAMEELKRLSQNWCPVVFSAPLQSLTELYSC